MSDLIKKLGYSDRGSKTQMQVYKMLNYYGIAPPRYDANKTFDKITRTCNICGNMFYIDSFSQISRKYCYECSPSINNPKYKISAMRAKVVAMRGGKCEECGYDKCIDALEFHHLDPSTKDMKLSNTGGAPSFERYLEEANKCALLCANCHREEHWRLRQETKWES